MTSLAVACVLAGCVFCLYKDLLPGPLYCTAYSGLVCIWVCTKMTLKQHYAIVTLGRALRYWLGHLHMITQQLFDLVFNSSPVELHRVCISCR